MRKEEHNSPGIAVHFTLVAAMLLWGFSFILSKVVFQQYTPLATIFFRLIISVTFLFIYLMATGLLEKIQRKDIWLFFGGAIFNPFLYFIGENYGLERVSASLSSVIIATIPVFAPFFAWYFFKERVSKLNVLGLIISFLGIVLIIFNNEFQLQASLSGILLLFMAVVSAVIYTLFLKKLSFHYRPITIIAWQNLIGLLLFAPLVFMSDFEGIFKIKPKTEVIVSLLTLGVMCSSIAFILFTYGVKHLGIIKSNLYSNLIPVITSIAAFFILKENFTGQKVAGILIVILGVLMSELNTRGILYKKLTSWKQKS